MNTKNNWKRFESHSIERLIDICQDSESHTTDRDDSFLALIFRFREELIQKCEIICKKRGYDKDVAREIGTRTFKRYGSTRKFLASKSSKTDIGEAFLFYLFKIARNELNDYYREVQKIREGKYYDGTEGIVTDVPEEIRSRLDIPEVRIIHDILLQFSEKHRIVYLTYMTYEKEGMRLPRPLLRKMREHLDLSQTTIRSYKKEVADKIEDARYLMKTLKT